jgi:hypothetical protein
VGQGVVMGVAALQERVDGPAVDLNGRFTKGRANIGDTRELVHVRTSQGWSSLNSVAVSWPPSCSVLWRCILESSLAQLCSPLPCSFCWGAQHFAPLRSQ